MGNFLRRYGSYVIEDGEDSTDIRVTLKDSWISVYIDGVRVALKRYRGEFEGVDVEFVGGRSPRYPRSLVNFREVHVVALKKTPMWQRWERDLTYRNCAHVPRTEIEDV